jgi:hypothetical protein
MPAPLRYGLARSYLLSGNLSASVTDAGSPRTVTVAASGSWVRPVIADPTGAGTSTSDPLELFTTAGTTLSTAAGGGTWAVSLHTDGRTKITWTGGAPGEITSGGLLAALGFASGTGSIASGSSAYSTYPALGLLLWAYSQDDTGWVPESDTARSLDGSGQLVVYRSSAIRHRRRARAFWVPRSYSDNDAGEYFSPAWGTDFESSGPTTVSAPDYNSTARATGWMDFAYGISGEIECGYTESVRTYLDGGYALGVSLGPSMFDPEQIALSSGEPLYNGRRDVLYELLKRREFQS